MKCFFLLSLLFAMSLINTACTQEFNYSGIYTNSDLGLMLEVKKTGDKYAGFFELQKQRYPFTGQSLGDRLEATYNYEGKKVPFTITVNNGAYNLNSEGYDIPMQRNSIGGNNVSGDNANKQNENNAYVPVSSGKRLSDPYGGYSFQIPQGWTSKEEQGSFAITTNEDQVAFSITPHNFQSREEMLTDLTDIVDESTNTHLKVTVKENNKNGILFHFGGISNGKGVIVEIFATLSPYGGGASFVSSGLTENYSARHTDILKSMVNSVRFTKPTISSASQQWIGRLKGKQLIYLSTSGGGSEKITINLNEDGVFSYTNNSSYMSGGSDVLSYAGRDSDSGTWKIQSRNNETVLILFANDRSTREYVITPRSANGEINLNNRRYFIKSLNY